MKYLEFYKKYCGKKLPGNGLCNCKEYLNIEEVKLFAPFPKDKSLRGISFIELGHDTDEYAANSAWGEWNFEGYDNWTLNPFRQNVVLFLAAINGEL